MPPKRSPSSRRPVPFLADGLPTTPPSQRPSAPSGSRSASLHTERRTIMETRSGFNPQLGDALNANMSLSRLPLQIECIPLHPLSPPPARRASLPGDHRATMDVHRGFNSQMGNLLPPDLTPSYQAGPVPTTPPSSQPQMPPRVRRVSRVRHRRSTMEARSGVDPQITNVPTANMAPSYQSAKYGRSMKTPPPGPIQLSPPPLRRASGASSRRHRTTVEDANEDHLADATREMNVDVSDEKDDFDEDEVLPSLVESSRLTAQETYGKKVPKQTPLVHRIAAQAGARVPQDAKNKYLRYAAEASKYVIGPMPVKDFLDFLPYAGSPPKTRRAFDKVNVRRPETEMYPQLIKAIEDGKFCPSIKFVNTSTAGEEGRQGDLKPDISGFDNQESHLLKEVGGNRKTKLQGKRYQASLGRSELTFEGKVKLDPFCDEEGQKFLDWLNPPRSANADSYETQSDIDKKSAFGQVVCYAVTQCARQHRAFLFSVMIIGSCVRLFRWDHAGIIVTRSFDFKKNPELLCEFLWRFHRATPAQRGYDPSVTIASAGEELFFEKYIAKEVAFQLDLGPDDDERLAEEMRRHYEPDKVMKVKIYDDLSDGTKWIECLISVPVASPRSVTGRGTRGYWAVILTGSRRKKVVFLKDIWRVDVRSVTIESEVYDEMMEAEVENTSDKLYGGDVLYEEGENMTVVGFGPVQASRSQEFITQPWVNDSVKTNEFTEEDDLRIRVFKHTHYRLILNDVGYPLSDFTGSRELFEAARDVIHALISAYEKCNRLHRDVSIGNIILVRYKAGERRKGILIDWEFSVKADREGGSTDYTRSGTWAFMSAAALAGQDHSFKHTRGDDFESVLYVVIFASVHWLAHNYGRGLGLWIQRFFYESHMEKGEYVGGDKKNFYLEFRGDFQTEFKFPGFIGAFFREIYGDLRSTTNAMRAMGVENRWTAENVLKHFDNVCFALANDLRSYQDRVENDTSDYYREAPPEPRATLTSSRLVSAAVSSSAVDDMVNTSNPRGSKRTLRDDGLVAPGNNGTASDAKRKRIELDGESVPMASGSAAAAVPETIGYRTRSSSRRSHARVGGSSVSHRMSRHTSKSSQPKLIKKGSDLSSKSSKSSSRRVRKPRSDTSRRSS